MFCEKCGTQLQDGEKFCPNCGTPVRAVTNSNGGTQQDAGLQPLSNMPGSMAAGGEVLSGNGAVQSQPVSDSEKPKKKSKKKLFVAIGAVAAAAVLGVVAFASELPSKISNLAHKTFSSSEDYYQHVEKNNTKGVANSVGSVYQSVVLDSRDFFETTSNSTITLTFGEGFNDFFKLAEGMIGEDLSWLKSISSSSSVTINGNKLSMDLSTSLNQDKLLSLIMALDLDEGAAFLQIPELSSTYLGVDLKKAMGISIDDVLDSWEDFRKEYIEVIEALPSQDRIEKLISKYIEVATACVDDVNKKSVNLKVEGVSQKCTALEVAVTPHLIVDMLEAILDEAEDDSELEKLITDTVDALSDVLGVDGDNVYENFLDEFADLCDELNDSLSDVDDDDALLLTLYVDDKGDVIGRTLEIEDDYSAVEIAMLMVESSGKFGYELSMYVENEWSTTDIAFLGSGRKSGDKISGEFVLSYNDGYDDMDILEITTEDLDTKSLKEGRLNGKFSVGLTSDGANILARTLARELGYSYMASVMESVLKDIEIRMSYKTAESSSECIVGVVYGKKDMISVTIAADSKKASAVNIPKSKEVIFVEDERNLADWVDTIDWKKFFSGLEKTDLPDFILDPIEDICDALADGDLGDFRLYDQWGRYRGLQGFYRYMYGMGNSDEPAFGSFYDPSYYDY
ncbi:MAG: zinc ribbon domain-containing protein [Acetatifactor sp.]|nr:zinc ribbon domain-containing protein [Acetatifactor sp.]